MTADLQMPVAERLVQLLRHLNIEKAHFAGGLEAEYAGLIASHSEMIASVTLGSMVAPSVFAPLSERLLVITGDQGPVARQTGQRLPGLTGARHAVLNDYFHALWSDVAKDRRDEVWAVLREFLADMTRRQGQARQSPNPQTGEHAGISYRAEGNGPPLVLLPIGLAPSQWDPLLPLLSTEYCTISLGGPFLGFAAFLEERGSDRGYLRVVAGLLDTMGVRPGERILEVGCGTGVLDRWLARRTNGNNPIVAVDINRYLLGEAASLARKEGLDGLIDFREGSAEALPLADGSFDLTMSITVLEEGNARQMLAEMVRVTKPGGRVGVVVRGGDDMPSWVNVALRPELKLKLEAPGGGGGKAEAGVADAGLYRLFQESGLLDVQMFPQLGAIQSGPFLARGEAARRALLSAEEIPEWQAAVATAQREGTFFVANPFHCAVGTKP